MALNPWGKFSLFSLIISELIIFSIKSEDSESFIIFLVKATYFMEKILAKGEVK